MSNEEALEIAQQYPLPRTERAHPSLRSAEEVEAARERMKNVKIK